MKQPTNKLAIRIPRGKNVNQYSLLQHIKGNVSTALEGLEHMFSIDVLKVFSITGRKPHRHEFCHGLIPGAVVLLARPIDKTN